MRVRKGKKVKQRDLGKPLSEKEQAGRKGHAKDMHMNSSSQEAERPADVWEFYASHSDPCVKKPKKPKLTKVLNK